MNTQANEVRSLIEKGIVPDNISVEKISKYLKDTCDRNAVEMYGFLEAKVIRNGEFGDSNIVSCRKVTSAFANYLVAAMIDNSGSTMDDFKWHASGTGTTAESNTDTTLETEITTTARQSGTQVQGASAFIYKTNATITYTASYTVTEHGIFSAVTTGTLLDRSVFAAINVASGESIEFTYNLSVIAES